jgi:3',5'-cyclic AMP phosphodiesterase CpdA
VARLLVLFLCACAGPREIAASAPEPSSRHVAASPDDTLRVAVISDLNGGYGSTEYGEHVYGAVDRILTLRPDLVLSTGDMVAGQRRGLDYPAMWASFHAVVSDRLRGARIPFAVVPGNHDASSYPGFAAERSQYVDQWSTRRPDVTFVDDARYPLQYSFLRGPAFFVALDSTTVGPLDPEQMRWLDEQLADHDDDVTIVFGHVPLYPFAKGRETEHIGDSELEELLVRHGVDLFISGHHHAYYPGRRGSLRLVSTACLGGGTRPLLGTDRHSPRSIVLFEVTDDGVEELDAYAGERFDHAIERASLPESVGEGEMRIERDDFAPPLTLRLR